MRILLYSHWFSPSIGGVETVSKILAEEFTRAGACVTVITNTAGPDVTGTYSVVRQPSQKILWSLASRCDVVLQNTISLRTMLPFLLSRRPIVVTHQSWLQRQNGSRGLENQLKQVALRCCHNVAISRAIENALPVRSKVIGNPFEANEFQLVRKEPRDKDIIFMGRLIPEKGCDLLLRAIAQLKADGLTASVSVVGDGTKMAELKALSLQLGISSQIEFLGALREGRGDIVARHRVMVIPSLWSEPFGIVALEGIACGCAIVASSQGGLREAVGPCGLYFPNGDLNAFTSALHQVLSDSTLRRKLVSNGADHLAAFEPSTVAGHYLELFHNLLRRKSRHGIDNRSKASRPII